MLIEDINGIGKESAEKLNTYGIRTTEDIKKLGWQKLSTIKYLGSKQVETLCNASKINISEFEIKKFRDNIKKNSVNKTPIKKSNKTLKFVKLKMDEEKLSQIIERNGRNYWNISQFDGEFAVAKVTNEIEIEKLLITAYPNHNPNTIIQDAFETLGYKCS